MISLLIYVLCFCLAIGVIYYVINRLLPEPMRNIATVILVVIGTIILIGLLLNFSGSGVGFTHLIGVSEIMTNIRGA